MFCNFVLFGNENFVEIVIFIVKIVISIVEKNWSYFGLKITKQFMQILEHLAYLILNYSIN